METAAAIAEQRAARRRSKQFTEGIYAVLQRHDQARRKAAGTSNLF
jgi:hypothetical protein